MGQNQTKSNAFINPSTDVSGEFVTPNTGKCSTPNCGSGSSWTPIAPRLTCKTDEECQHLDSFHSTPNNPVFMCPTAKCSLGKCNCGTECKFDSYSGSCCQDLQTIGDISFCVSKANEGVPSAAPMNSDEIAFQGIPLQMLSLFPRKK
jgi:hypothetical protein